MHKRFLHLTGSFIRPADVTQYSAGDHITATGTAIPITFSLPEGYSRGRVTGARAVVTPASANLVITALDFDLLLFRPNGDVPFAAGAYPADNAAMAISAAAYRELVGHFSFVNTAWRNTLGALTAGITGWQAVTNLVRTRGYPFDFTGLSTKALIGVVQAIGVWNPGAVANTFNFNLDCEVEAGER